MSCFVCDRIDLIKKKENPFLVTELETGYVVLGDYHRFEGYTLFLCKKHVFELHHLEYEYKMKFLEEMSLVAHAVQNAFHADKMNYELLGNGDGGAHAHWHLFPRREGDTPKKGPVWCLDKKELYNESFKPSKNKLNEMIEKLQKEINILLAKDD